MDLPGYASRAETLTGFLVVVDDSGVTGEEGPIVLGRHGDAICSLTAEEARALADALIEAVLILQGTDMRNIAPTPKQTGEGLENFK